MSSNGFCLSTYRHFHAPGMNMAQRMLLSRMSSLGVFFEAPKNTAKFLNYTEKTIQVARQALVRSGYIFELENTGRGKKYLVRADFRPHELNDKDLKAIEKIKRQSAEKGKPLNIPIQFLSRADALKMFPVYAEEPEEVVPEQKNESPLKPSTSEKKARSNANRAYRSEAAWNKAHPDLVEVAARGKKYLTENGIPLFDGASYRKQLSILAHLLDDKPDHPEQPSHILGQYLDYIESDTYYYQIEHSKFVPRITTQDDIWRKFSSIREFARDKQRHYDPSKVLT